MAKTKDKEKSRAADAVGLNELLYWRNVEDELPKEFGKYLCFHPDWGIQIVLFKSDKFSPIGLGDDYPTHWMPLPKEPI